MRRVSLFFIVTLFFSGLPVTQAQAQEEQPRVLLMDLKNNGLDENLVKTINSVDSQHDQLHAVQCHVRQ